MQAFSKNISNYILNLPKSYMGYNAMALIEIYSKVNKKTKISSY